MKMHILGVEHTAGTSKKTGSDYDIGTLHTMIELAPAFNAQSLNKGFAGDKLKADGVLLRKLANLPFPLLAEVTTKDVMQFGKRETIVVDGGLA